MIAIDVTPLAIGPRRGVARALHHLLLGLTRLGLAGGGPAPPPVVLLSPGPLPPDVPRPGEVLLPPRPPTSARAFRRALPRLVARSRADAFLSPWSAFPDLPVPTVVTVHELPFVRLGPVEGRLRTWRHRRWLRRDVCRAARIVVPSEATRRDLLAVWPEAAGKGGERVVVVQNGFDPAPWEEARRAAARAAPPRLVLVGTGPGRRGARKKGVDTFLQALPRIGAGPVEARLVGEGRARGLPPGASFCPGAQDGEVRSLVASAAVLVHPARSEGFGYPPLEAMAAGVPVVASRAGAIPEVAGEAALLVPPGDPDALAAAIRRVLREPDLAAGLVAAGERRARLFAPERTAAAALGVLDAARSGGDA